MEMDLKPVEYTLEKYEEYILGSAEVVGLMCLKIFVYGSEERYQELKPYAMKLGSAFQKINFFHESVVFVAFVVFWVLLMLFFKISKISRCCYIQLLNKPPL